MTSARYTDDGLYNRIMDATYNNPGDDIDQGQAAHALAQEIAEYIAALEDVAAAARVLRDHPFDDDYEDALADLFVTLNLLGQGE